MTRVVSVLLTNRKANLSFVPSGLSRERWKSIPGFGSYQASTLGRLRRVKPDRRGSKKFINKILKPQQAGEYFKHCLVADDGSRRQVSVQILVARTFIGPRPGRADVNHIDTNKRNNRLKNLEYRTRKKNMEHAVANGLTAKGERHGHARLVSEQVVLIRAAKRYSEAIQLAKKFCVSRWSVEDVWYGKTWKHLL